jgi:hypothetical protein
MIDSLSRRNFIETLIAIGAVGLIPGCKSCNTPPAAPAESPYYLGPFPVGRAVLGITPGSQKMLYPTSISPGQTQYYCPEGNITISTGSPIPVMIYYPSSSTTYDLNLPINMAQKINSYPVMLFGHAKRSPLCASVLPAGIPASLLDITQDYTRMDRMLSHVASYGCVIAVPDLSSLVNRGYQERADVLTNLYNYLSSLNSSLFQNRLDLTRIILSGHSTGGGACLLARGELMAAHELQLVAMGLVAPATSAGIDVTSQITGLTPNGLLVIRGLLDMMVNSDPLNVYNDYQGQKILVTIPGANHFGYTDVCTPDNKYCAADEVPGTIIPFSQQLIAGAYLSALVRKFGLNDTTVEPYLNGTRALETQIFGVTDIQVQQSGM